MASYTSNLNLKLPDYSDTADIKDLNDNFKKIDEFSGGGKVEEWLTDIKDEADKVLLDIKTDSEQALSDIQTQAEEAVSAIENKANDALDSIPEDYQELEKKVGQLKDTKADAIIDESAKAAIHELHAQDGQLHVTLYGNATETGSSVDAAHVQASGKNLAKIAEETNGKEASGVKFTVDNQGRIHCTGIASATIAFYVSKIMLPPCSFTYSGAPSGASATTYSMNALVNGAYMGDETGNGVSAECKLPNNEVRLIVVIRNGVTVNDLIFSPQIELGTVKTAYEPYNANVINPPLLPDGAPLMGNGTVYDTVENDVPSGCNVKVTFDGSADEPWQKSGTTWSVRLGSDVVDGTVVSNLYTVKAGNTDGLVYVGNYLYIGGNISAQYADITALRAALAANPLMVFYRSTEYTPEKDLMVCRVVRRFGADGSVLTKPETYMTDPLPLRKPDGIMPVIVIGNGETSVSYTHDVEHFVKNSTSSFVHRNLVDRLSVTPGFLLANLSINPQSQVNKEWTSDFIKVTPGETYTLSAWCTPLATDSNAHWLAWGYFDRNKVAASGRTTSNKAAGSLSAGEPIRTTFVAPANVVYIRVSARLYNDGRMKLERGAGTPWTDFDETEWVSAESAYSKPNPYMAALIPPAASQNTGNPAVFDFNAKTVTFPRDTVFKPFDGYRTYVSVGNETENTVVSWASMTTSAVQIVYDPSDSMLKAVPYNYTGDGYERLTQIAFIRTTARHVTMNGLYEIVGVNENAVRSLDVNSLVNSVAHRGYSTVAPENTLAAYKLAKTNGFEYAECDVSFTSDGVAVLLHDATIDRTSNGTGAIGSMTFDTVRQYDFGSWKSDAYAGELIPTFEEFIMLCKRIGLKPYIELKGAQAPTSEQILGLVNTVKRYGMLKNSTWISFSSALLDMVKEHDPTARLGFVVSPITNSAIQWATSAKTDANEVFLDVESSTISEQDIESCVAAGVPVEVWTINDATKIAGLDPYVSGFTSDNLVAGAVLHDAFV